MTQRLNPAEHPDGGRVAEPISRSARFEAVTLGAYHEALRELRECGDDPLKLLAQLGSVDRQAADPATSTRLALAGRLIAAAQLAGQQQLTDAEVHAHVRSWLQRRGAERDDAAPSVDPRVPIDEEEISGLDQSLIECDRHGGLSGAAWTIAALILQHLVRPPMEITRTLTIHGTLDALAARALDILRESFQFTDDSLELSGLLIHAAVRVRAASRALNSGSSPWGSEPHEDWLAVAAGAVGAHAALAEVPVRRSMRLAVARATSRLASSLVPDQPERFSGETALEHAVDSMFDAVMAALGLRADPHDPVLGEVKADVLESLLEATSSALIGAWVVDRLEAS